MQAVQLRLRFGGACVLCTCKWRLRGPPCGDAAPRSKVFSFSSGAHSVMHSIRLFVERWQRRRKMSMLGGSTMFVAQRYVCRSRSQPDREVVVRGFCISIRIRELDGERAEFISEVADALRSCRHALLRCAVATSSVR